VIELLAKFILAYLLGTVMGGVLVGRMRGGVDLRTVGSGNVGATNALRTQGKGFAAAVFAIDLGKGVLAVTAIPALPWILPGALLFGRDTLPFACGVAVALGHIFPAWFHFHGGKGAATLAGVYATLLLPALPWMALAFILVLIFTGYVGLGSVTAALTALLYVTCFDGRGVFSAAGLFTGLTALLVIYTHRNNLARVWTGSEHRFEGALVLKRLWRRARGQQTY
jgi:glycerol-3-phosphate acyltransferase PlsY